MKMGKALAAATEGESQMVLNRWSARQDDQFVDLIYDAAVDDALWPSVLQGLADRAGAHPGNLLQIDIVDGHGFGVAARVPDDTVPRYFAEWAQLNPLGLVDDVGDYRMGWMPRITHDSECLDRRLLEQSDYWNKFLVPVGAFHMITMRLALRGNDLTSIGLGRPNHLGAFENDDVARIASFHRHLIRAERIGRSLGLRQAELDQFDTLLATSPDALFFLDDQFRLLRWTAAGDALLRHGGALSTVGGRLRANQGAADAALRGVLADALASRTPLPLTLPGVQPGDALSLSVARLGERALAGVTGARCLMVSVRPLAKPDPTDLLRTRHGLTKAEAELTLALSSGESLRAVAKRREVSYYTVRNQLSAVFDKTGCRRQQDLVRLLTSGVTRRSAFAQSSL